MEKKLSEMWNEHTKITIYKTTDKFPSPTMILDSVCKEFEVNLLVVRKMELLNTIREIKENSNFIECLKRYSTVSQDILEAKVGKYLDSAFIK